MYRRKIKKKRRGCRRRKEVPEKGIGRERKRYIKVLSEGKEEKRLSESVSERARARGGKEELRFDYKRHRSYVSGRFTERVEAGR